MTIYTIKKRKVYQITKEGTIRIKGKEARKIRKMGKVNLKKFNDRSPTELWKFKPMEGEGK